ncbi:MAG: DNA translocase FtsK 4TM domain-containing protein [Gammaproteobacteria bacterium]|nr:DNA translocase FtsK 4TM domain-containing protein [Gammaproteobacteria bacterium]
MTQINKTTQTNRFALMVAFAVIPVLLLIAILLATALLSYHATDPAWTHSSGSTIENSLGFVGAWYSDISFSLLGKMSYLLPIALVIFAIHTWLEKGVDKELLSWRLVMLMTAILSGCVLWTRHDPEVINSVAQTGGGALGAWLTIGLEKSIKSVPVIMGFSLVVFVISISLLLNFPWLKVMEWIGRNLGKFFALLFSGFAFSKVKKQKAPAMKANITEPPIVDSKLKEKLKDKIETASHRQIVDEPTPQPIATPIAEKEDSTVKNRSFTIDRYQPEEPVAEQPTEQPQIQAQAKPQVQPQPSQQTSEPVDLSYFGISDKPKKTHAVDGFSDGLIETSTSSFVEPAQSEQPAMVWDSPITNTQKHAEIPVSVVDTVTDTYEEESKPAKSEPSLFDLGELKKRAIKRAAIDTIQSKLSGKTEPPVDIESIVSSTVTTQNVANEKPAEVEQPITPVSQWQEAETPVTDSADNFVDKKEPISFDMADSYVQPINFDTSNDVPDVIEPTPELQESFRHEVKPSVTDSQSTTQQMDDSIVAETIVQPMVQEVSKEREIVQESIAQPVEPVAPIAQPKPAPVVKETTNATIGSAYKAEEITVPEQPYELPSINLLDTPPPHTNSYTEDMLADMALVLETTLKQFNVSATVMHVSPGPVITRFEIELAAGIMAKKISNLSQDLARALAVSRVRVEEVIPGSTYVGLEVPNKSRETVYFRDVVCSKEFQDSKSPLTVSLGSDTSGKPVVADLMKMPHALVAGTTGSGKSVCINVMLLSMLYKASPKDLRLILVDPKMLEMSMYEDIPHLLTPVITDMNEAENALTWAVGEMERRYQLMSALKVRKIDAFNEQVEEAIARGEPIKDPLWEPNESVGYTHHPTLERLPFIVIVIDELADMMMVVGKQVEQLIARLTQKARAAGIHVVLATQRPSTDVLTGLIKANVPTRVAFQVSSGTDSRVIIDGVGAEKLLGHGDMLYVPPGASHPQRLHGAFVGDAETDRITNYLRSTGEPDYIAGITTKQDPETLGAFGAAEAAESKDDADPLYEEAVQVVLESGKASISSVQRQLRIGYNRAARMIEDMQEQGIVSEPVNGIRKVLGASHLVD